MKRVAKMPRKKAREETTFGDEVVDNLKDFFEAVDRGETITVRTVKLDLQPHEYTAEGVRGTRSKLGVSQSVFAKLLAVQVKTVQAWEQGERPPAGPVRRLLDQMNRDPKPWVEMLSEAATTSA